MTTLRSDSSLTRKTSVLIQSKPLVLTLHDRYLEIRRAGAREAFRVSYDGLYLHAAQRAAEKIRAERQAQRKARKERAA
ncbi:MAG TPA: hypothetical protein VH601_16680 [Bryobacteraceae bacterium]|jgi:hypothetical protein